jgi:hypothetical protein
MPLLDASHDFAHPVESDAAWSESYYFNCYDPDTDLGFFTRIGVRPNKGTLDSFLALWLPSGEVGFVRAVREQHTMTDSDLAAGGVAYVRLEPMRSWRLSVDADVTAVDFANASSRVLHGQMEAEFSALTPAIGADGQTKKPHGGDVTSATRVSVGKGHLEQAGRWSGSVTIDGANIPIGAGGRARGNRDKSWGPRRWGGPTMWRWFSVNIGDDVHFGGIRIGTAAGDLHRGWVWRDGSHTSIVGWDIHTEVADDGLTHEVSHVRATDKTGRVHKLRGDMLRVARLPHGDGTVVIEGLARWAYEGREGYGVAEYLHQLDAAGRPVVPIA